MAKSSTRLLTLGVLMILLSSAAAEAAESTKDLYWTGYRQFKSSQYKVAIDTFNHVIDLDRFYWEAYWGRGFASAKLGQFANALNEFSRYLAFRDSYGTYGDMKPFDLNYTDNCEQAASILSNHLKAHKKWYLYAARSVSYMKLKKILEAKADLDEAIKDLLHDQTVLVATTYAMRGNCNLALGHAEAAIADYSTGLDARQLMPIFRARALAYRKLGKNDMAEKDDSSAKRSAATRGMRDLLTGGGKSIGNDD